jgi:hypothetical protein
MGLADEYEEGGRKGGEDMRMSPEAKRVTKLHVGVSILGVVLFLGGCQRESSAPGASGDPKPEKSAVKVTKVLKIKVTARGDIICDGRDITLEQLATKLEALKRDGGGVWYHREHPEEEEPHPNAEKVFELITDNRLPVRLAVKPDFSESAEDQSFAPPAQEGTHP